MKEFEIKNKISNRKNILTILFFTFCFFGVFSFADAVVVNTTNKDTLRNGLVGHWTMDGKDVVNGVLQDKSGNGNMGSLMNISTSTFYTQGKLGQGFKFDGVDDKVTTSSDIIGTGDDSVCAWINPKSWGGSSRGRVVSNNKLIFWVNDVTANDGLGFSSDGVTVLNSSASVIFLNKWQHVCVTRNSAGSAVIYVNAISVGSGASGTPATGVGVAIGANTADTNRQFDGIIDDVRIYNRALSASEITQLYNLGAGDKVNTTPKGVTTTGLNSGLVGWWTMDGKDVAGGTIRDMSGNGNHGGAVNIATSTFYTLGKIGQALRFDGVNDYVNLGSNAILTAGSPFTISWWEKITGDAGSYPSRFALKMNGTTNYFALTRPKSQASYKTVTWGPAPSAAAIRANSAPTTASSVNIWRHFVLVGNDPNSTTPGDYFLYVDNVSYATSQAGSFVSVPQNRIGYDNVDSPTNATLDDVRIYNRALSASEITQLYNLGAGDKVNTTPKGVTTTGLNSGLVGWWTMDGKDVAGGTIRDMSGNGNHGGAVNIATSTFYTLGKIGQALRFDGVNDYVQSGANSSLEITGDLSVSLWVKSLNLSGNRILFSKYNSSGTVYNYHGFLVANAIYWWDGNFRNTGATLTKNKWTHLVYTKSGTTVSVYLDGVLSGTPVTVTSIDGASGNFWIGKDNNGQYFGGQIDELRVYNRVLSLSEIKQLYNMGR